MAQKGFFKESNTKVNGTKNNLKTGVKKRISHSLRSFRFTKDRVLAVCSLFLSLVTIIIFIAFAVNTNQRMTRMNDFLALTGSAFHSELATEREKIDFIEQNFHSMGSSLNDVRVINSLPEITIPRFRRAGDTDSEGSGKISTEASIYSGIDQLVFSIKKREAALWFNKTLNNSRFNEFLIDTRLELGKIEDFSTELLYNDSIPVFQIRFDLESDKFVVTSLWPGNSSLTPTESFDEHEMQKMGPKWIELRMGETEDLFLQWNEMNKNVVSLFKNPSLEKALKGKNINSKRLASKSFDQGELLTLSDKRDRPLLEWGVDIASSIYFMWDAGQRVEFSDFKRLEKAVLTRAGVLDDRLAFEVKAEKMANLMQGLYQEEAFNVYLEQSGLIPGGEMKEDDEFYYFDLFYSTGLNGKAGKVGMFGIQKSDAKIILMDEKGFPIKILTGREADPIQVTANDAFGADNEARAKSRRVADYNVPGTVNILLVGRHAYATDSLMILHLDKDKNKGTLVSIPRDLYYKGIKINNYYIIYGIDWLKNELSEITGLPISHYIMVDMYAFIDLVDLLGGIDVTLVEDLVDPTYKIKDELGNEKTLFYRKGDYHLTGREALRVARSRHGSNDYSRSARQQQVLSGIKTALVSQVKGKSGRAGKLIEKMGDYIDTDISPALAARYVLQYGKSSFSTGNTMSDKNVLYYSYSNIYRLSRKKQEAALKDREFEKGGYILLPKDGDWNLIRKYLRDLLDGKKWE